MILSQELKKELTNRSKGSICSRTKRPIIHKNAAPIPLSIARHKHGSDSSHPYILHLVTVTDQLPPKALTPSTCSTPPSGGGHIMETLPRTISDSTTPTHKQPAHAVGASLQIHLFYCRKVPLRHQMRFAPSPDVAVNRAKGKDFGQFVETGKTFLDKIFSATRL